ncbi:hypothetical protein TNCV_4454841 [Trichonephila clavipes]|nr:hypothetical protein TNCV_4454841 [Trichonephila clavipes]
MAVVLRIFAEFIRITVTLFRPISDYVLDFLYLLFMGKTKQLPPIDNKILLIPAVELAEKIRKRQGSQVISQCELNDPAGHLDLPKDGSKLQGSTLRNQSLLSPGAWWYRHRFIRSFFKGGGWAGHKFFFLCVV